MPASGDLSASEDSLDRGQARQFVGPDTDRICLTLMVFMTYFFKEKIANDNNREKLLHKVIERLAHAIMYRGLNTNYIGLH